VKRLARHVNAQLAIVFNRLLLERIVAQHDRFSACVLPVLPVSGKPDPPHTSTRSMAEAVATCVRLIHARRQAAFDCERRRAAYSKAFITKLAHDYPVCVLNEDWESERVSVACAACVVYSLTRTH
jgi:hypothetical protein